MYCVGATELMVELFDKSLPGEVGGADTHGRQDRTPGLARRGKFAKLTSRAADREIAELARAIARARRAVVFTGAGISTESGIPDFRSPGGIWTQMAPIDFDSFLASDAARRETWRRRFAMEETFAAAAPNRGHRAVDALVRRGKVSAVITQNIDGLHQASGIPPEKIIELHGNTTYATCLDCGSRYEIADLRIAFEAAGE